MINSVTGSKMTVADNRVDEYLAAGHKLAVDKPVEKKPESEPVKAAVKKKAKK